MNPSFRIERKQYLPTETGNSANGSNVNKPTIARQKFGTPTPDLNPSFKKTRYNNNSISYEFPLYPYNKNIYNKMYNNRIGKQSFGIKGLGNTGLAGNGNNQNGAGYRPLKMTPYKVNSLGAISGISQSFPYNLNGLYPDGSLITSRPSYTQVNQGVQEQQLQGVYTIGSQTQGVRTRQGQPPQPQNVAPTNRINAMNMMRQNEREALRNSINMRRQDIKLKA